MDLMKISFKDKQINGQWCSQYNARFEVQRSIPYMDQLVNQIPENGIQWILMKPQYYDCKLLLNNKYFESKIPQMLLYMELFWLSFYFAPFIHKFILPNLSTNLFCPIHPHWHIQNGPDYKWLVLTRRHLITKTAKSITVPRVIFVPCHF